MAIEQVTMYKSSDGKLHDTEDDADTAERIIEMYKFLELNITKSNLGSHAALPTVIADYDDIGSYCLLTAMAHDLINTEFGLLLLYQLRKFEKSLI